MKKIAGSLLALLLALSSRGESADCGKKDPAAHATIKAVTYQELPKEVKRLMKDKKCDVKTGSNYDYGVSLDLNEDQNREFAFCCTESGHGPCGMSVFGQVNGQWKQLLPFLIGFDAEDGFTVLSERDEGYHRICQEGQVYQFQGGQYREGK
jgi:hypothetical protein